jgi:hypothetical protein
VRGILQSEPLPGLVLNCKLKDTEEVWNPASGGPGADVVPTFTAKCKSTMQILGIIAEHAEALRTGRSSSPRTDIGRLH